jgi:hypothetical protein
VRGNGITLTRQLSDVTAAVDLANSECAERGAKISAQDDGTIYADHRGEPTEHSSCIGAHARSAQWGAAESTSAWRRFGAESFSGELAGDCTDANGETGGGAGPRLAPGL